MKRDYIIRELIVDGYERWICLEHDELKKIIWAHYIDQDYIESNVSIILEKYKVVEGELSVDFVLNYEKTDDIGFEQPIANSSHIVAHAKVMGILDDFSVVCQIDGFLDLMKVEFEKKVELKIGQNIKIKGSLEIEIL
jgi:hypothetical protein